MGVSIKQTLWAHKTKCRTFDEACLINNVGTQTSRIRQAWPPKVRGTSHQSAVSSESQSQSPPIE